MRFLELRQGLARQLLQTQPFHTGEVHAKDTSMSNQHQTYELTNFSMDFEVPNTRDELSKAISPHLPWADEHFEERVSGTPHNPPPSHVHWPWSALNPSFMEDERFSHTYPERFWPRRAGLPQSYKNIRSGLGQRLIDRRGIRYRYGDLNDLIDLLVRSPLTRQAYLPVWFPEDTGATSYQRVPCSLGYHFMIRDSQLDCWYALRSCDFVRYFQDDVYLACRLMQWVVDQYKERTTFKAVNAHPEIQNWSASALYAGSLHITISSLHAFLGDTYVLNQIANGET